MSCIIDHERIKLTQEDFDACTTPVGIMDDGTEKLVLANCIYCQSTIARCLPSDFTSARVVRRRKEQIGTEEK